MLWIKEVEMVNLVDEFQSSRSIQGTAPFPDFESALNKIIQNSYFKNNVNLEEQKAQKADRFLRGRQTVYLIYDYFWSLTSTILYSTMLTYFLLFFGKMRFRNSIQDGTEFYYLWKNSHLMIFWKAFTN